MSHTPAVTASKHLRIVNKTGTPVQTRLFLGEELLGDLLDSVTAIDLRITMDEPNMAKVEFQFPDVDISILCSAISLRAIEQMEAIVAEYRRLESDGEKVV